ncbi:MAG: hypothetical protein ACT4P2_12525 [Pseudomonadota bacterium]
MGDVDLERLKHENEDLRRRIDELKAALERHRQMDRRARSEIDIAIDVLRSIYLFREHYGSARPQKLHVQSLVTMLHTGWRAEQDRDAGPTAASCTTWRTPSARPICRSPHRWSPATPTARMKSGVEPLKKRTPGEAFLPVPGLSICEHVPFDRGGFACRLFL